MERKSLILIADPDTRSLATMEKRLKAMDLAARSCRRGRELESLLGTLEPSVVILDAGLSSPDSCTLCEKIKDSAARPAIPVVFIAGRNDDCDRLLSMDPGKRPDAILQKPCDGAILEITISSMLHLREQYHKLDSQYENLKKMEKFRENLIYMMAHDMRLPLQSIYGYCAFLDGSIRSPIPREELSSQIKNHAYRLNQMLQNVLDLRRLESHQMPLYWETIMLQSCLQSCRTRMQSLALSHGVNLEVTSVNPDFAFTADGMVLGRIMDNLVNNAIKFSPRGETVMVHGEPVNSGEEIVISVSDRGPGIEEKYREKIFEVFGATELKNMDTPSVGLGLAFCKTAVSAHGGEIVVEDHPGGGSLFKIRLPVAPHMRDAREMTEKE